MIATSLRTIMYSHFILIIGVVRTLGADASHLTPLETMADVTNDFGVCVLQIIATPNANTVFSPYGLVSMALLVYEGTAGQAAAEIYNTLHLPWHRDIVRIGFRDLHRYLRSYFSSEGFLKGLVLSKPNVRLRPAYIEVLKFYGFQSDSSTGQPVVTTTQPSNQTETTNVPETTTIPTIQTTIPTIQTTIPTIQTTTMPKVQTTTIPTIQTTLTTLKEIPTTLPTTVVTTEISTEKVVPNTPTKSTINTTQESATEIITVTNKVPSSPEVMAMRGPEIVNTTTKILPTAMTTTAVPEEDLNSITYEIETTEMDTGSTKVPNTTQLPPKTTPVVEVNLVKTTNVHKTTLPVTVKSDKPTTKATIPLQEIHTEPTTTEMNVVTINDGIAPSLESMNMILLTSKSTDKNETKYPKKPLFTTTLKTKIFETRRPEFWSTIPKKVPTTEVTTETVTDATSYSTMFVDTAVPIETVEELVFITTPPDVEVVSDKSSSKLEAIILLEEENSPITQPDYTTDNSFEKRSTDNDEGVTISSIPQEELQYYLYFDSVKENETSGESYPYYSLEDQDKLLTNSKTNKVNSDTSTDKEEYSSETSFLPSLEFPTNIIESQADSSTNTLKEVMHGFPKLEPDTIIFPKVPVTRLPRSVKDDKKPAQLGNWVGDWRPSPTEQWFWTFAGDKQVPVLTYTAFLPYAEVPALRASILQLPLDDPRYSLTVLLPKSARGLKSMLHTLQWQSLRSLLKSLKPTPVYAVVPNFTIVRHVNLTPVLQKLGIRNVFDSYSANLSEMTEEPNIFVRSVEQAITISVRKYFSHRQWLDASPSQVEQNFLATHPFAYFVVDEETKVSLVAGTIVDPTLHSA